MRSMDWTLEDNMVDGLFFCATLTGRRGSHAPFVQAEAETSNTGVEAVKPDCPPTPHSIDDPPNAPHVCCCCQMNWWDVRRVQMGVSIWTAVYLHLMERRALSGAVVQAPRHDALETVWLHCDEAQQVGCLRGLEGCPLVYDAGIQSQFARRRWWRDRWGGYDHCGSRHEYSAFKWNRVGVAVRRVVALASQPGSRRSQQAASGVRRVMSASCEVTQDVGDTWATCPTLLRGFVVVFDLSSRLASLLLRWKAADTVFVVLSLSFQVWWCSLTVAMSLVSTPSTACQSPSACMIARSSAYAYFLETVTGRSEI